MATSDPLGVPQIDDKRTKPSGLLPKNAQAWVLAMVALVMVLVILFSGRTAPKQRSKEPPLALTADPSLTRIEDVRRRIEELAKANQAATTLGEQGYPPLPPAYGGRGYGYTDTNPQRSWVDSDEQKRQSRAPFSSNVALSYRKEESSSADEVSRFERRTLGANLTDPSDSSPFAGSGTSQRSDQRQDARLVDPSNRRFKTQPARGHRAGETEYPVFEGTVLETVLTNRLDGYFSGPVNCMVTTDIYSPNGAHILLPSGSRVLGEVRRVDTFGQQRLAVIFHRLIMPDGYSVLLDQFKGLNQIGETGLRDQVNNHYVQLFGVSLAIGAIAGLAQSNTTYGADVTGRQAYEQGVANSLSQTSLHILDRYLNVLPTFTIREGHRVKIYLTQDLRLPSYDKHITDTEPAAQPIAHLIADGVRASGAQEE